MNARGERGTMRKGWVWIAVAGALVAAAWASWSWLRPRPPANVVAVRRGEIAATISALGRVAPVRTANLSPRAGGTLARLTVREGDRVEAGRVLAELDGAEQRAAVAQAERSLALRERQWREALAAPSADEIALARARLRRATAARLVAQRDYDEIAKEPDAESSDEALALEAAKLELEVAQAEFDRVLRGLSDLERARLETDVELARLALREAQRRLDETRVVAPFAGTVLRVLAREGENVGGYGPLMVLADLTRLEIRAEISELDIPAVAEGQAVTIRLDAFPGAELTGAVARVLPGASDARGATLYEAVIALPETDLALRPGMGANLTIITRKVPDTLLVPRRALRQVGRHQVARILTGRRSTEVVVTTGLSNEVEIQVLSGLDEGQRLLVD
ncbi:MAG: efflux RND transporter periplasmic adaptor subunit [Chloroflexota bacterium]